MKKLLTVIMVMLCVTTLFAFEYTHVIILKDSSMIKGKLVKYEKNDYLFYSPYIGNFKVNDKHVVSIKKTDSSENNAENRSNNKVSEKKVDFDVSQLKDLQTKIMQNMDAQTMQKLMNSEALQSILSNPQLMKDIQSGNVDKLMNNPDIIKLMQDSTIQELLQSFE